MPINFIPEYWGSLKLVVPDEWMSKEFKFSDGDEG